MKKMTNSIRLVISDDLKEKVEQMRNKGINISQLLRNFLLDFQIETNNN